LADLTSRNFLTALQLGDSFFPSGMYAQSLGLEGLVRSGVVLTADDVEDFLSSQIVWSVLPSDGVALLNAHGAAGKKDLEEIGAMDKLLYAMRLPAELRTASTHHGRRLLTETASIVGESFPSDYARAVKVGQSPGNGAVAMGIVGHALGLSSRHALLVYVHGYLIGLLGASLRLLSLGHSGVQISLNRLLPVVLARLDEIEGTTWQDMTAFTPQLDVAALRHVDDDLRMFAS
jgi:urease accessory protein